MKISVICPSRLAKNPSARAEAGDLYLDRSLMNAVRNARDAGVEYELIVGLDPGGVLPARFDDVKVAHGTGGQSSAVNAAAKLITGDFVAMVEDDDTWRPGKLAIQLDVLSKGYTFCSSTQREIDGFGAFLRYNNFACPSTWVMPRSTWEAVGPFDETFRWHVDTEWLGRLNVACREKGWKRAHIAHVGSENDPWLKLIQRFSDIGHDDEITDPLVDRTVNEEGGMAAIRKDAERLKVEFVKVQGDPVKFGGEREAQDAFEDWSMGASPGTPFGESVREHREMARRWGVIPW